MDNGIVFISGGRKVKLCNSVIALIKKYRQLNAEDAEAGGVLIARENREGNTLVIEYATEPMVEDQRNRYRFYRKDQGHLDFYKKVYSENQGVYAYIGEWHTHPEQIPHYSIIDIKNWKRISKQSNMMPQFHLIAGISAFRIWEVLRNRPPRKMLEIEWDATQIEC